MGDIAILVKGEDNIFRTERYNKKVIPKKFYNPFTIELEIMDLLLMGNDPPVGWTCREISEKLPSEANALYISANPTKINKEEDYNPLKKVEYIITPFLIDRSIVKKEYKKPVLTY